MEVKPGIPAVSVDEELLKELAGEVGEGDTVTVKLTVSSSSSSGSSQPILPFVDVKRTDEWYQAIKYVYEKKLMEGASVTTFDPEGELTRAMLATMLYRAAGSPKGEGAPISRIPRQTLGIPTPLFGRPKQTFSGATATESLDPTTP